MSDKKYLNSLRVTSEEEIPGKKNLTALKKKDTKLSLVKKSQKKAQSNLNRNFLNLPLLIPVKPSNTVLQESGPSVRNVTRRCEPPPKPTCKIFITIILRPKLCLNF